MKTTVQHREEPFGRRLAALRKKAGYTQHTLADAIGISHRMMAYYEAQTERPPGHLLPALAEALGISTDELLGIGKKRLEPKVHNQRLIKKLLMVEKLPKNSQRAILEHIDALLTRAGASGHEHDTG